MNEPLKIFIGYDRKEPAAFHVLAHSILTRSSLPVSITPLTQHSLRHQGLYWRERAANESTEFSISRFLVPALCQFQGYALFLDCDMLMQADIGELWMYALAYPDKAVHVCQHDYVPTGHMKFLGQQNAAYPRKNWSSVMLFNCHACTALTPEYINQATGLELHRFNWLDQPGSPSIDRIGALPLEWNWLVGEYPPNAEAKNLHFTLGGPWFPEYEHSDHADLWKSASLEMSGTCGRV